MAELLTLTTREELDADVIEGGRDSFRIAPNCHPKAALHVRYWRGALFLECAVCNHYLAGIAVAKRQHTEPLDVGDDVQPQEVH